MLNPRDFCPAVMFSELLGADPADPPFAAVLLRADAFSGTITIQTADRARLDALLDDPRGVYGRLADGKALNVQYPDVPSDEVPAVALFSVEQGLITLQAADRRSLDLLHRELVDHPEGVRRALVVARASLSTGQ